MFCDFDLDQQELCVFFRMCSKYLHIGERHGSDKAPGTMQMPHGLDMYSWVRLMRLKLKGMHLVVIR